MLKKIKKKFEWWTDLSNPNISKLGIAVGLKRYNKKFKIFKNCYTRLHNNLSGKYFLFPNAAYYEDSFFPFLSKPSIKEDYQNLIKGLDEESINTVSVILHRIMQYKNTGDCTFTISEQERKDTQAIQSDLLSAIVQIEKNLWAYKNYYLLVPYFVPEVFYYRHFIDTFKTIDRNKAIIDIGCFIGDSALVFSEYTNDTVYSFEPLTYNFNIALKTMELNNIKNIKLENFGLSDKKSDLNITVSGLGSSISTSSSTTEATQLAHFETLDDYVAKNKIKVGFIKADIEGAEQLMLAGAKKTICEQKPALCICIYHSADDFFHIKTLIESWNLGYTFRIVQPVTGHMHGDTVLLAEVL